MKKCKRCGKPVVDGYECLSCEGKIMMEDAVEKVKLC